MRIRLVISILLSIELLDVACSAHASYKEEWMTGADITREQAHSHAHKDDRVRSPTTKPSTLSRADDDPIAAFARAPKPKQR